MGNDDCRWGHGEGVEYGMSVASRWAPPRWRGESWGRTIDTDVTALAATLDSLVPLELGGRLVASFDLKPRLSLFTLRSRRAVV